MTERSEAELVAAGVDLREWGPTEPDEAEVLESLGHVLDGDGIYRHPDDYARGGVARLPVVGES